MAMEDLIKSYTDRLIRSDSVLMPIRWGLKVGLSSLKTGRGLTEKSFELLGVPTRSDVKKLHQKINELEQVIETSIEVERSLLARCEALEMNAKSKRATALGTRKTKTPKS
jgi:hypothetical protein